MLGGPQLVKKGFEIQSLSSGKIGNLPAFRYEVLKKAEGSPINKYNIKDYPLAIKNKAFMGSDDLDFKFEKFEEYCGDAKQVKKQINECKMCGSELIFAHFADYKNLYVQETSCCPECEGAHRKLIHILN